MSYQQEIVGGFFLLARRVVTWSLVSLHV